ncbi:MAG: pyridoxine 5'-phosphate synthase, partial [Planctomycetota bacterium]
EGGLDVAGQRQRLTDVVSRLHDAGMIVSAFIDAEPDQVQAAAACGFDACEVHTGTYTEIFHRAGRTDRQAEVRQELERISRSGELIRQTGMQFNAGHGLTYYNVQPIAALPQVRELHIGHSIVSRAVFTGLRAAVGEMKRLMREAAAAVAAANSSSVGGMA